MRNTQLDRTPNWFELNPTKDAMIKRLADAATRYAGDIDGWDIFNEIMHDKDYFIELFGDSIFEEMIQIYKFHDPNGRAVINEYETLRADKSRCFLDKAELIKLQKITIDIFITITIFR